eukprot:TRINITY_DN10858_c0_g1_i2.p1 TRINITY_DN10858_c0_g1~~TRINITY_DN10858_c0_g1_i2.p1  ORF type:complete len:1557 (+),score=637.95 TRINITY_DN10858_c0_g1_i2:86-4756(+)
MASYDSQSHARLRRGSSLTPMEAIPKKDEAEFSKVREKMLKERLDAYREDLAAWFSDLFKQAIHADEFMEEIASGVKLCQLAKIIEDGEADPRRRIVQFASRPNGFAKPAPTHYDPRPNSQYKRRDNVTQFLTWARSLGVSDAVLFEADDLVGKHEDLNSEKNVLYSLMELGRVQGGVAPPLLVEIERAMEKGSYFNKITEEEELGMEHDMQVLLDKHKMQNMQPVKMEDGTYRFGDLGPFKVAQLRGRLMVRLPNTWDTLEHVLLSTKPKNKPMMRRRNSIVQDTAEDHNRNAHVQDGMTRRRSMSRQPSLGALRNDDEVNLLKVQLKSMEEQLKEARDDIARLGRDNEMKAKDLQQAEAQQRELRLELEENSEDVMAAAQRENRLRRLEEENEQLRKRVDDGAVIQAQLSETQRQLQSAQSEKERSAAGQQAQDLALRDQIRDLTDKLGRANDNIRQLQANQQKQTAEFERIINEKAAQAKSDALKMEDDHDQEIQDLEEEIRSLSERNAALLQEHTTTLDAQAKAALAEAQAEAARQQAKADAEQAALRAELAAAEQRKRELADREEAQARELEDMKRNVAASQAAQAGHKATQDEIKRLQDLLAKLREDHSKAIDTLHGDHLAALADAQAKIDQVNAEASIQKQAVADKERQLREAQDAARSAELKLSTQAGEVTGYETQLATARDRTARAEAEAEALDKELTEARRKARQLEADLLASKHGAGEMERKLEEAQSGLARERAERDALKGRELELETALRQQQAQVAALSGDLERERSSLKRSTSSGEAAKIAGLEDEVARLKAELALAQQALDALRKENADLHAQLLERDNKIAQMELQIKQHDLKMVERDEAMEDLKSNHRADMTKLTHQNEDLEHELERARRELDGLKNNRDAERDRLTGEIEDLKAQLGQAQKNLAESQSAVDPTTNDRLSAAQARLEELDARFKAQRERYEDEIRQQRKRCMDAERSETASRLEKDRLEGTVKSKDGDLRALQDRLADTERQLAEMTNQANAPMGHSRRYAEMDVHNLTDRDVADLCLHDDDTRDAHRRRLEAKLENDAASEGALEAQAAYEADRNAANARKVAAAQDRRRLAAAELEDSERAFFHTAETALDRLRAEEQERERREADPEMIRVVSRENVLDQTATAQKEIVELSYRLKMMNNALETAVPVNGANEHDSEVNELKYQTQIDYMKDQHDKDRAQIEQLEQQLRDAHVDAARQRNEAEERARQAEAARRQAELERELERERERSKVDPLEDKKEEVAAWINELLETNLKGETLLDELKSGIVLCQVANVIDEVEEQLRFDEQEMGPSEEVVVDEQGNDITKRIRERELMEVQFLEPAPVGSKDAKSNVKAFIEWARGVGLVDPDVFAAPDLTHDMDPERVLDGMLKVARRTRSLPLPDSVMRERAPYQPTRRKKRQPKYTEVKGDEVDAKVAEVLNFVPQMKTKLKRVAKGKYRIADEQKLLLMRVLRDRVLVRVGGGWEELQAFLEHRAKFSKYRSANPEQVVQDVLLSTPGPGLCSTRTKLPQRQGRQQMMGREYYNS